MSPGRSHVPFSSKAQKTCPFENSKLAQIQRHDWRSPLKHIQPTFQTTFGGNTFCTTVSDVCEAPL